MILTARSASQEDSTDYKTPPIGAFDRRRRARLLRLVPAIDSSARSDVQRRDGLYRRALVTADATAALLAILVAVVLLGDDQLAPTALLAAPFVVLISKLIGLYDRDELLLRTSTLDESPALFQQATLYTLMFWLLEGVFVDGRLGKIQVLGIWGVLLVTTFAARALARAVAQRRAPRERCLVVGDLAASRTIASKLDSPSVKADLVAQVPLDFAGDRRHVMEALRTVIDHHDAHRVVVAPGASDNEGLLDAVRLIKSMGVKVSLLPRLFEVVGSSVVFDDLDGATVLGVRRFGLSRSSAMIKRAMDVAVAASGVLAVAPVFAGIALAVRLSSPGPVFFRQTRVGRDGEPFEMLKFRSMVQDADAMKSRMVSDNGAGGLFKMANDPRVTRVGRILRASSLDELPQLLNVLRGDMSLVGPRPLIADEDALVLGWHRRRQHLTPGMTGPWQVLGSRQVPFEEMVKIDYIYIANWSFWIDVKILVRTAAHVLRRAGV